MKKWILAGVTVTALGFMAMSPAEARDGCGPWKYRAWNGRCYWLRPPPPPPEVSFGYDDGPWGWHRGWGWGGGWGWHRPWWGVHHGWGWH